MDWRGLRQSDVARLTGVSSTMISEYIRGVSEPTVSALRKLADGLNVSPWALLNNEPLAVNAIDLTKVERQLIGEYRLLSNASRRLVETTIKSLHKIEHSLNAEE